MKLMISAYACIPDRGSEPGVGWNWTLEHARLGHEVWCFTTPDGKEAIEKTLQKYPELKLRFVYVSSPPWANWLYQFQPFVYFHYLQWQYNAARIAQQIDKKVNVDLILHITLSNFQLGSGFWRIDKPLIFGPVGGGNFPPKAFKRYFGSTWSMEILRKFTSDLLLRFNPDVTQTCKKAKVILAANNDTYVMARTKSKGDVRVVLDSGLSNDFFNDNGISRNPGDVLKILWVGRIYGRKGLPLVLEALSHVCEDVKFHLTILGDGKSGHKVPGWILKYKLQRNVTWHGQVSWQDVRKAYQEHDVFLLCSLRDSFGSQFLEAMAYGLPIITLDHQGAGDHIPDDGGIKVPVMDVRETIKGIAKAVEYMYHHPDRRIEFGKHGYDFARTQTWERKVRNISMLYEEVIPFRKSETVIHEPV